MSLLSSGESALPRRTQASAPIGDSGDVRIRSAGVREAEAFDESVALQVAFPDVDPKLLNTDDDPADPPSGAFEIQGGKR